MKKEHRMKVSIIAFNNLAKSPYVNIYADFCKANGVDYEIVFPNRDGIRETAECKLTEIPWDQRKHKLFNFLRFRRDTIRVLRDTDETEAIPAEPFRYPEDGTVFCNRLCTVYFSQSDHTCHREIAGNEENIYKLSIPMSFRSDTISGGLRIRTRQPGDSYRFGGMTRRLKKLFIDRKMTSEQKALTPILCDDKGILWVPGFPPRDGTAYLPGDSGSRLDVLCHYYELL